VVRLLAVDVQKEIREVELAAENLITQALILRIAK
jgi:hypothetical protein